MTLTVRDLVETSHLGTRIHAGRAGLDHEVTFACTCEMTEPWEWLSEGDLLLTSGLGLPERPSDQAEYVRQLSRAGISGLSVGEPVDAPPISAEMVRTADRLQLPLLITAYEVPFMAISRAVVDANAREGDERLRQIARLYERVRTAAAETDPGSALLALLGRDLRCRLAVYDTVRGRALLTGDGTARPPVPAGLRDAVMLAVDYHGGRMPAVVQLTLAQASAIAVPIPASRPASLAVVREDDATMPDVALLQHVASVLGVELERSDARRRERLERHAELLSELLDAPMAASVARYRLAAHGIDGERLQLGAWGPGDVIGVDVLHDTLADAGIPHLLLSREIAIVTLQDARHDLSGIVSSLPPATRVGLSTPFMHPQQAADALRQAVWALQAAGEGSRWLIRYGEDHAPFLPRTLSEAHEIIERLLGPLLAYDREHSADLVHTLRVFLQSGRSWKRAAELLFIHRQTLVYRIRRIESVSGRRLDETSHVAEMWFALRALDLAGGRHPREQSDTILS